LRAPAGNSARGDVNMATSEFEIIRRYFAGRGIVRGDVVAGIGDDAAVLHIPSDRDLVIAVDTLVAGVHFPPETRPEDVGYKSLAVNLSDAAAMGAVPAWATLALTLPHADEAWLSAFADGFFGLAEQCGVQLIGGDTTRGPLTVSVQVQALARKGRAVWRSGARPGDIVYVTGAVGDAALALHARQHKLGLPDAHREYLSSRLSRPQPRCKEGEALCGLASAMIDVSDGLAADLTHILEASGVGATLNVHEIPLSPAFSAVSAAENYLLDEDGRWRLALGVGDDYELCFTVPAAQRKRVEALFARFPCGCRAIGVIEQTPGLRLKQPDGSPLSLGRAGYDHFVPDP
jgi:thiamine-monophosphate kinase